MAAGTVDNDNTDALLKGRGKTEKEDREMAPDWATPAVAAHIQMQEGRGGERGPRGRTGSVDVGTVYFLGVKKVVSTQP